MVTGCLFWGPQHRALNAMTLIMGTPQKGIPNLRNAPYSEFLLVNAFIRILQQLPTSRPPKPQTLNRGYRVLPSGYTYLNGEYLVSLGTWIYVSVMDEHVIICPQPPKLQALNPVSKSQGRSRPQSKRGKWTGLQSGRSSTQAPLGFRF